MKAPDPLGGLSGDQKRRLIRELRQYLRDHLDIDPGDFGVELLLHRAGELIGPVYYNQGLSDARTAVAEHAEALRRELAALHGDLPGR
jgi:uncharacterized protein (DUF2164 family)